MSCNRILVKFDNKIGTVIASETLLSDDKYVECDGRAIAREGYDELFNLFCPAKTDFRLPDYTNILGDKMHFYLIVK